MEKLRLSTITNISASHEMCNELRGGRRERNANSDTLSSLSAVVNPGARRDSTRWFFFFFSPPRVVHTVEETSGDGYGNDPL